MDQTTLQCNNHRNLTYPHLVSHHNHRLSPKTSRTRHVLHTSPVRLRAYTPFWTFDGLILPRKIDWCCLHKHPGKWTYGGWRYDEVWEVWYEVMEVWWGLVQMIFLRLNLVIVRFQPFLFQVWMQIPHDTNSNSVLHKFRKEQNITWLTWDCLQSQGGSPQWIICDSKISTTKYKRYICLRVGCPFRPKLSPMHKKPPWNV